MSDLWWFLENANDLLFGCHVAASLVDKISKQWDITIPTLNSFEDWWSWFDSLNLQSSCKSYLEGVFFTIWRFIWLLRNSIVFDMGRFKKRDIWDKVITQSFLWVSSRTRRKKISYVSWLSNPMFVFWLLILCFLLFAFLLFLLTLF